MNILKKIGVSLGIVASILMPALLPASVYGAEPDPSGIQENLCAGANLDVNTNCNTGGITDQQARDRINNILKTVIRLFSIVVGVASVVMIIIGGLKYITSGGDSGNVSGAKNTILYAIIGIVVVALAQFIVRFVLTQING